MKKNRQYKKKGKCLVCLFHFFFTYSLRKEKKAREKVKRRINDTTVLYPDVSFWSMLGKGSEKVEDLF